MRKRTRSLRREGYSSGFVNRRPSVQSRSPAQAPKNSRKSARKARSSAPDLDTLAHDGGQVEAGVRISSLLYAVGVPSKRLLATYRKVLAIAARKDITPAAGLRLVHSVCEAARRPVVR